jgi:hypothetical protein
MCRHLDPGAGRVHGLRACNDPRYSPTTCFETFPFPAGLTPQDTAHQRTDRLASGALIPAGLAERASPDCKPNQVLLANDGEVLDQCRTATRRMRKMNSHTQRTPRIRRGRKENRWIFWLSASSAKSLRPLRSDVRGFQ